MHGEVPRKRMSVFTAIVLGISSIAITAIVSAAGIAVYGMRIVDTKSDSLLGTARTILAELPEIQRSLPPILADAVNDERRPDYRNELEVSASLHHDREHARYPSVSLEITNHGEQVVSLLAVRTVLLDEGGRALSGTTEYVATPIAIDNDWRGPLLPGSTRRATTTHYCRSRGATVECEITEVRLWRPGAEARTDASADASADLAGELANLG
ncbi:MAG: hypothetical protein GY842_07705 [bacterium]|nr:hypothetical protein [bacterium]